MVIVQACWCSYDANLLQVTRQPQTATACAHHCRLYPNGELVQVPNSLSSAVMHSETAPLSDVKVQGWGDPLRPVHMHLHRQGCPSQGSCC